MLTTPEQVQRWLDGNLHRMDNPAQWLGTEPNARRKPWDKSAVRWLLAASWPYFHCLNGDSVVLLNGHGPARMSSLSLDSFGLQADCGGQLEQVAGVFQNGVRDVVEVRCQGGFAVTCTPDHLIRVARPASWRKHGPSRTALARSAPEEWVAARDLQPGDVLKTYYGQNIWAHERVVLPRPVNPGSAVTYPGELSEDLAWLLGLLATDCSVRWQHGRGMSSAVRWSADDPGVLAKLLEVIPRVFGKAPVLQHRSGRSVIVELASTPLVAWLRDVVGVTERRRVPDAVFQSPREVVAAYLCGLFDGDGEVCRGRFMPGAPKFSNSEESLVRDVYVLLMNMGAPVSVHRQDPPAPLIRGRRVTTFRTVHRLHALWAEDMDWSWLEFSHTYRRAGLPAWSGYQPVSPGRCKASGGVSFCTVTEVAAAGQAEVYDIAVPRTTSFTANGIVVHNSAGNQSVPAVYQSVNDRSGCLADLSYLPETPRDLRMLERGGVPVFGIESKHPLADFDVVGTSISYSVLFMNYCKLLQMSGIPLRWRDRGARGLENFPMVIIGGQAFCAPGAMEPVADCIWLGEVEDEPGNGGIGLVCSRIEQFKRDGRWQADRLGCYQSLAREFNYLFFPRFTEVLYGYQDFGLAQPTKAVTGYRSLLEGQRMPFRSRRVKDMDKIAPLRSAPLLYSDPSMGAGDLEVARGCPAWTVGHGEWVFQPGEGLVRVGDLAAGKHVHPGEFQDRSYEHFAAPLQLTQRAAARDVTCVIDQGEKQTVRVRTEQGHYIETTPETLVEVHTRRSGKLVRGKPEWRKAAELSRGDVVPIHYGQAAFGPYRELPESGFKLDEKLAWLTGFLVGDGAIHAHCAGPDPCALGFGVWAGSPVEQRVEAYCQELFGGSTSFPAGDGKISWVKVHRAPLVRKFCRDLGFAAGRATEGSKLHVPELVMRSPESVQRAFVLGLFEADGQVDADGKFARLCSVSERLVREVGLLLLNLGVANTWHKRSVPVNRGLVRGGKGFAFHLTARPALDSDLSWWEFLTPHKEELARRFRERRVLDRGSSNVNYLQSRKSPIMARVVSVEDVGSQPCADFMVPEGEAFDLSGLVVHNCSFCRLTYIQKPYRQRSVGESVRHARVWTQNMGSVELSPFSPDFPMHTQKKRLLTELLTGVLDEVDTTAMRVDDFNADNEYVMVQAIGGADAVTLGLEGNSQRMRDLVGKGTSDADVEEAVYRGIRAGFRKFKLFMIVSLPGEDTGDVYRIVRLAKRLAAIRDELGQPNVRFQFSWTPLLIEAKTPFQWFAPTPPDHTLIDVADLFRQLKVDFKIGTKAEPNKVAFFQLAQRASREVGEAIVDVLEELSAACWGGVPRDMRDLLEAALKARGFANGFADCFGVRDFGDLFGHEYIDTGVSERLLWDTYRQMVEFLQGTDSRTYDDAVADARVHGNEWIARCDRSCLGKTCGACDPADLKLRSRYIAAAGGETQVHLSSLRPIDLTSQACKIRVRLDRPAGLRWVGNAHWRYSLRRAAYQAAEAKRAVLPEGTAIAKRSIRFASDGIAYRDWCAGTDYAEFALTRDVNRNEAEVFLKEMALRLAPWLKLGYPDPRWPLAGSRHARLAGWELLPPSATLGTGMAGYYELELAEDPDTVAARLAAWEQAPYVKLVLHGDTSYFGVARTEVNAKELVSGIWMVRDGHWLRLRMLITGKAGPYQVYAALMGKPGWLDAAGRVARRLEWFFPELPSFPVCLACGAGVPQPLIEEQSEQFCPRCSTSRTREGAAV